LYVTRKKKEIYINIFKTKINKQNGKDDGSTYKITRKMEEKERQNKKTNKSCREMKNVFAIPSFSSFHFISSIIPHKQ